MASGLSCCSVEGRIDRRRRFIRSCAGEASSIDWCIAILQDADIWVLSPLERYGGVALPSGLLTQLSRLLSGDMDLR